MRISSALSLLLLAGALGACGPAYRASAVETWQQGQHYLGVWVLVDNAKTLLVK